MIKDEENISDLLKMKKAKKELDKVILGMSDSDSMKPFLLLAMKNYAESCVTYTIENFFNGKLQGLNSREIVEKYDKIKK